MRQSNNEKVLDSKFYESDVAYLSASSKRKPSMASDKQPFFKSYVKMGMDCLLNTDGKTMYNCLRSALNLHKKKIDYNDSNHRLYFPNKIVSNINSVILGVYHGICKHMLPLYFSEFEWRFNHRHTKDYLGKIMKYLRKSSPMTRKSITETMNNYASERGLV